MSKFYFFTSSNKEDELKSLTIITNSIKKAYILAFKYFAKHNYIGVPKMLVI